MLAELLQKRLEQKGWKKEKIRENVDAESIDVILCEAVEFFNKEDIFEINTTKKTSINGKNLSGSRNIVMRSEMSIEL